MKFSERLKELRKERNLSQTDVAKYLDIHVTSYGSYETGKSEPNIDNLIKLAKLYSVSIDYILGLNDDRHLAELELLIKKMDDELKEATIKYIEKILMLFEKRNSK